MKTTDFGYVLEQLSKGVSGDTKEDYKNADRLALITGRTNANTSLVYSQGKKERFHLPHDKAKINQDAIEGLSDRSFTGVLKQQLGATLPDIWKFDELYNLYPELKDVKIEPMDNLGYEGGYDAATNTLYINRNLAPDRVNALVAHEVNHSIQSIDKVSQGQNPDYGARLNHIDIAKYLSKVDDPATKKKLQSIFDKHDGILGIERYLRNQGEREARLSGSNEDPEQLLDARARNKEINDKRAEIFALNSKKQDMYNNILPPLIDAIDGTEDIDPGQLLQYIEGITPTDYDASMPFQYMQDSAAHNSLQDTREQYQKYYDRDKKAIEDRGDTFNERDYLRGMQ